MKTLRDFKEEIHKCSRCGLCQEQCPVYKVTGNDCAVSRGKFVMLQGVLNGDLKLSKTINRYLDLCLKCGKCSKFCPSGIDVVDVVVSAKSEYYKDHFLPKIISLFEKTILFGLLPKFFSLFTHYHQGKKFDKKVLYFAGCGGAITGDKAIIKILNSLNIGVINPNFDCCGMKTFSEGDLNGFNNYIKSFVSVIKKYNVKEIVVSCASCENVLKSYERWTENSETMEFLKTIKIRNIYEYLRENNLKLKLKKPETVTYHKPCHIENLSDIEWVLNNTENLNYIKMNNYDNCCGLNSLSNPKEIKIFSKIYGNKRKNIINSGAKTVLTSCLGCEIALNTYSFGAYKVSDLIRYIVNRL